MSPTPPRVPDLPPALREILESRRGGWFALRGPPGSGKTTLLRRVLASREGVVFRAAPMSEADLLEQFRAAVREALGELPRPRAPGILPDPGGAPGWRALLLGLASRPTRGGRPLIVVFDDWDELVRARRRLPGELAEALEEAERRGGSLLVIVTLRGEASGEALEGLPAALGETTLGPLPLREAAATQGGRDARDGFLRWACLGNHPGHRPPGDPGADWESAIVERVLAPGGDLYEAPLYRLASTFRRPARYGSILRALAAGPLDWRSILERSGGLRSGGQLAPYLGRLEEEGLVVSERPLGAAPDARNRRYRLADPFWAFWMGSVLPARGALLREPPEGVWRHRIRRGLEAHLARWLPVAVREWFERHAHEAFPAPSREVGGLWGARAEFDAVAWLTNGQVCYVSTSWTEGVAGAAPYDDLRARMSETRYGIGRQARAPVLVVTGPAHEELRRRVAREPLARLLDLSDLMGMP